MTCMPAGPPWDIGGPQPAFLSLARAGLIRGRVLDAGCGTRSVRSALPPGGRYFLLCASNAKPPDGWERVYGVSLDQLTSTFSGGWRADSIEPATIDITAGPGGIPSVAGHPHQDMSRTPPASGADQEGLSC